MTSTFFFAVNLTDTSNFISQGMTSTHSPFYNSNQDMINSCPSGMFAYVQDTKTNGTTSAGCNEGCCGNGKCGTSQCCSSNCSQSSCANFSQCNPGCTEAGSHWSPVNFSVNYNCYLPNPTLYLPYTNGQPSPLYQNMSYVSLYPSVSNPTVALYSVTYNNSDITTTAQLNGLITSFGSQNSNVQLASSSTNGVNYGAQNDQVLQSLLKSICSSNDANLFTKPCSSFCSSTPNTIVPNTTISSGNPPTNCQPAWNSYCSSPSNFTTSSCLGWYTSQMQNTGNTEVLPASSYAYQILTTNCNNPDYFTPPPTSNPYGAYTINPNAPQICGCFYPPNVSQSWYTNLEYTYPGLTLSDTLIQCNYPPCSNTSSVNYLNTNPSCPVENTTVVNCINSATIINSTTGDIQQTSNCAAYQNVDSTTITTSPSTSSVPPTSTSSVISGNSTTTTPNVVVTSLPPTKKKKVMLEIILPVVIVCFLLFVGWIFSGPSKSMTTSSSTQVADITT